MPVKFVDDLQTRVATVGGIDAADLLVDITPGDGAKIAVFVNFASGEYCYATFRDAAGNLETVKITARNTDQLTIARAQDAADVARAWAADDILDFALCQGAMDDILADIDAAVADAAAVAGDLATHVADTSHIESNTVGIFGQNSAPTGWTRKSDWQNNAMLCYAASGDISAGGSVDPQAAHAHAAGSHSHSIFYRMSAGDLYAWYPTGGYFHDVIGLAEGGAVPSGSGVHYATLKATAYEYSTYGGSGNTGDSSIPHYQEVIAATKD